MAARSLASRSNVSALDAFTKTETTTAGYLKSSLWLAVSVFSPPDDSAVLLALRPLKPVRTPVTSAFSSLLLATVFILTPTSHRVTLVIAIPSWVSKASISGEHFAEP